MSLGKSPYDPIPPQPPSEPKVKRSYVLWGIGAVVVLAAIAAVVFR